jgi:hypothetical protein
MQKRQEFLAYEETKWCLKSRALWLKEGDGNTKFFHNYACQCKQANTIWEVKNSRGEMVSSFDEIVVAGKDFYSDLFRAPPVVQ